MAAFGRSAQAKNAYQIAMATGSPSNGDVQNSNVKKSDVDHPTGFEDLKLSTAAGIRARFPWIMPAATARAPKQHENRKNNNIRLVDGGYFENSDTETVGDLIRAIEKPDMTDGHPAFKKSRVGCLAPESG